MNFNYVDDQTPIIEKTLAIHNERQKLELRINKKDSETKEAVVGAVFGLYAHEDISNADGKVIVESDDLLETSMSDAEGKVIFLKDYPLGHYYIKEIEAPRGYVKSDDVIMIDALSKDSNINTITFETEFLNEPEPEKAPKTSDEAYALLWGSYGIIALGICIGTLIHLWRRTRFMRRW